MTSPKPKLLVVDDRPDLIRSLTKILVGDVELVADEIPENNLLFAHFTAATFWLYDSVENDNALGWTRNGDPSNDPAIWEIVQDEPNESCLRLGQQQAVRAPVAVEDAADSSPLGAVVRELDVVAGRKGIVLPVEDQPAKLARLAEVHGQTLCGARSRVAPPSRGEVVIERQHLPELLQRRIVFLLLLIHVAQVDLYVRGRGVQFRRLDQVWLGIGGFAHLGIDCSQEIVAVQVVGLDGKHLPVELRSCFVFLLAVLRVSLAYK